MIEIVDYLGKGHNISLTWILRHFGMIPQILTMISSEGEQWGHDEIYPDMGISINGSPKWMASNGKSNYKLMIWGYPPFQETSIKWPSTSSRSNTADGTDYTLKGKHFFVQNPVLQNQAQSFNRGDMLHELVKPKMVDSATNNILIQLVDAGNRHESLNTAIPNVIIEFPPKNRNNPMSPNRFKQECGGSVFSVQNFSNCQNGNQWPV